MLSPCDSPTGPLGTERRALVSVSVPASTESKAVKTNTRAPRVLVREDERLIASIFARIRTSLKGETELTFRPPRLSAVGANIGAQKVRAEAAKSTETPHKRTSPLRFAR